MTFTLAQLLHSSQNRVPGPRKPTTQAARRQTQPTAPTSPDTMAFTSLFNFVIGKCRETDAGVAIKGMRGMGIFITQPK